MKNTLKKIFRFIWHDNSIWSWIINVILAFIIVKFLVYPGLGLLLGTTHPLVAVVSSSMEHNQDNFEEWWDKNGKWYVERGINKIDFQGYKMENGFNKGDIIILKGFNNLQIGDIIVFRGRSNNPIIHRIVKIYGEDGIMYYQTKGDNNADTIPLLGESKISKGMIIGGAYLRVPYLGWIKVWFSEIFGEI